MGHGPIIEAIDVCKTYRSRSVVVEALKGVTLSVARGEMVAIMGPSGSGKTTLLNCISGLDGVDQGEVSIDNQPLQGMSDDALSEYRAKSMGFVFQAFNLLPVLSARENVELPLVLAGVKSGTARTRAMEKLEQVGLVDWADHMPNELSGGQIQRVAIARALANDPAIVWADEPTGNLDSDNTNQVMDLLCDLNETHGQTFVLVTHTQEVGGRAHRIVNMRDGLIEGESIREIQV
ncbi:MAG: ABC transporter ATP-binding protein [Chloroflexi bacterium]|nr:ABC transporter ATP-binding protein [Chloroflexota bacterium]